MYSLEIRDLKNQITAHNFKLTFKSIQTPPAHLICKLPRKSDSLRIKQIINGRDQTQQLNK
jgi:hypothetical protein